MARFLSHTLLRLSATATSSSSFLSLLKSTVTVPFCVTVPHRHRSSQPSKPRFFEIDLSSSSSPSLADAEYELALKRLDDLLRRFFVQKATPDWLPFSPGSSFWVPPLPTPSKVIDLVEKLSTELRDEESFSISNFRDLVDADVEVNDPEEMELKVELKFLKASNDVAHSEDEEG